MSEAERVVIEVTVAARVEDVWRALRDPAEIRRWFGWEYDGLDAEIDQIFGALATVSEADRVVDTGDGRFAVEARGDATVVRVTRAAPAAETGWDGMYEEIEQGWFAFVQQLRFALERHPGEDRRTVFLAGDAREPELAGPAEALGLGAAAGVPVGGRYEATTSVGDALTGRVEFRSEHQLGLSVDAWGDGLLVMAAKAAPGAPLGGAMAILTAYGLDDARVEELAARWSAWWDERYSPAGADGATA